MEIISNLLSMIFLISIGGLILKYRRVVKSWTGEFAWAENYLGRGGTYTVIIFIGIFLIFWGFMMPFGGLNTIFGTPPEKSSENIDVFNG